MNKEMEKFEKTDLILLMLLAKGMTGSESEPIKGITKLMKLLFLLEREGGIKDGFQFRPYKMGPFSSEVYPELEFLQTFPDVNNPLLTKTSRVDKREAPKKGFFTSGSISSDFNREMIDSSVNPEQLKTIDDVAGNTDPDSPPLTGEEINAEFKLTDLGVRFAKKLSEKQPEVFEKVEEIKQRYSNLSLRELLRYVYSKYPDTTTESEIMHQVF